MLSGRLQYSIVAGDAAPMVYFVQRVQFFLGKFHEVAIVFGQDEAQSVGKLHRRALRKEH